MKKLQPFKINPPSTTKHKPLSKSAVETSQKWSPPPTESIAFNFDHSNLPFRRHGLTPTRTKIVNPSKFSCAGFSAYYDLGARFTPYYLINFKHHRIIFPTYKCMVDYLSDYYIGTISESIYNVKYGSFLWEGGNTIPF